MTTAYQIVTANNPEELSEKVEKLLVIGWELVGGVSSAGETKNLSEYSEWIAIEYCQALKDDSEWIAIEYCQALKRVNP